MKLLHGTSSSNAEHIMKSGLKPRRGAGNWYKKHQFPANKQFVFLASIPEAYEFHAMRTALIHNSYCTVVEAEVEEEKLYPDENLFPAKEQVGIYHRDQLKHYQELALDSKELWKESLEKISTVAHRGSVEVDKLKVVMQYPIEKSIYYGWIQHHEKQDVDAFDMSFHAFLNSQQQGVWQHPKYKGFDFKYLEIFPTKAGYQFKYKGQYA